MVASVEARPVTGILLSGGSNLRLGAAGAGDANLLCEFVETTPGRVLSGTGSSDRKAPVRRGSAGLCNAANPSKLALSAGWNTSGRRRFITISGASAAEAV